jgi:chromosome segregation ATPase
MENNELLQAIRQIVKEENEPLKQDISSVKTDISSVKTDISSVKTDISTLKKGQEALQKDVSTLQAGQLKINIELENNIDKKLSALFDGHQLDTEKIDHISETVDDIDASVTAMDIVTHANVKEINKLKAKIG